VPIVDGLGPRGNGAHALDEQIEVESLLEQTMLIALLVARAGRALPFENDR
jgi:hypothetical protein